MKKIYSLIMVASLMLTSVLSFTSCQKDEMPATMAKNQTVQTQQPSATNTTNTNSNTSNTNATAEQTAGYNYFGYQMFVNDELLALGDIVVTANYDGKTVDYKVSEGQTASVKSEYFVSKYTSALAGAFNIDTKFNKEVYSGKKLVIPTFQAGSHKATITWKFVPDDAAITANMDGVTDAIIIAADMASKENNIQIDATDLEHGSDSNCGSFVKHFNRVSTVKDFTISKITDLMTRKANTYTVEF